MSSFVELDPIAWSEKHFGQCELGDVRRTRRLVLYAQQMAGSPDGSTPQQTEGWGDCKAVYRLFNCEEVQFATVTAEHYRQTCSVQAGTYFVIHDKTEIDYGYKSNREGLGRLGSDVHRGFFLQSALMVETSSSAVVGLGAQELYIRPIGKVKRVNRVKSCKRTTEAEVWGRVMDRVVPLNKGVKLIHVCDREADNFDVFAHLHVKGDSWIIRAAQLRRIVKTTSGERIKLQDLCESLPPIGRYQVFVRANKKQKERWATVEVRSCPLMLVRPPEGSTSFVKEHDIREITTNMVEVREVDTPKGCEEIRWVLYTREPVSTNKASIEVIGGYEHRPIIEEFHKAAKTGLEVESRQYQLADRLQPLIGLTSVQAVRLLQLRDVARIAPDTPAKRLVPPQWLEVIRKVLRRPVVIKTVGEFMRALASLGGFLGRKSDGEPGWIVIWRGMKSLALMLRGYTAALDKCG